MKAVKLTPEQQSTRGYQAYQQMSQGTSQANAPGVQASNGSSLNAGDNAMLAKVIGGISSAQVGEAPSSGDKRQTANHKAAAKAALKFGAASGELALEVLPDSTLEPKSGHYGATGQATGGQATGRPVHASSDEDAKTDKQI